MLMVDKRSRGKKLVKRIISLVLAVTCVMALTACSGKEGDGKLESGVITQTAKNWIVSQYKINVNRKSYVMQMPAYTTLNYDYCDYNQCIYKGNDADMYVFILDSYAYTAQSDPNARTEEPDVVECEDALSRSEWLIERTLVKIYSQTREPQFDESGNEVPFVVDISYETPVNLDNTDITMSKVNASTDDTKFYGYWIYHTSRRSFLILFTNEEMADNVIDTLYIQ